MLSCYTMSMSKQRDRISMQFKTGDLVLCINDDFPFGNQIHVDLVVFSRIKRFPKLMEVYTVRRPHISGRAIFLAEIINPLLINANGESMQEPCWKVERFVKLPKQKKERIEKDEIQLQLDIFLEAELSVERGVEVQK